MSYSNSYDEGYFNNIYNKCTGFIYNVTYVEWFTLLIYVGLVITLLAALSHEHEDLFNRGISNKHINKYNNGASYYLGKVSEKDDLETILQKIRISCRHDVSSVYWRRSIAFSIIISFLILIVVLQRFPTGLEWIVAVLILYLAVYFFLVYYQHVVSKPASNQVNEATNILKCRYDYKDSS